MILIIPKSDTVFCHPWRLRLGICNSLLRRPGLRLGKEGESTYETTLTDQVRNSDSLESYQADQTKQVTTSKCFHLHDLGRNTRQPLDWHLGLALSQRSLDCRVSVAPERLLNVELITGRPIVLFFILFCYVFEVQLLLQIIINRIAIIVERRDMASRIKWLTAAIISAVNIAVFCIWIPAHMTTPPSQV